jgi:sarcosine oxidase subunit alpha
MASLELEGRSIPFEEGDSIASALYRAGVRTFSRSFKYHRPRGLYCLTGDCPNCLVTVDGEPGIRACVTPAEGQRVARENAWPSADRDLMSAIWLARRLLPVGFYYKTLRRPEAAWPLAERFVRRIAGIGRVSLALSPSHREARHHHPDVFVAGGGVAGLAAAAAALNAGETVLLADENPIGRMLPAGLTRARIESLLESLRNRDGATLLERAQVVGIYEGPLVPVCGEDMLHVVHPRRVVVATGAVERHGVFPGNDLVGVWLARGAARLAGVHGLSPGRKVVLAGRPSESGDVLRAAGVDLTAVDEGIIEATGRGRVQSIILESGRRILCDALVLALGLVPRDGLVRQAVGLPVVGAGDVVAPGCSLDEAEEMGRAAALGVSSRARGSRRAGASATPQGGFVCLCEDVEVRDLEDAWEEGFRSTELLKRYTTATMGPCQGALCEPHLRECVGRRAGEGHVVAPTTARPPARPIRLEDAAAGVHFVVEQRTALHERHLALGAVMEWVGSWKRPQTYGDPTAEYWAVRRGVSIMDVSTLGKFLIGGRDAGEFLERLYPCHVRDIPAGRLRYGLLLNEAGFVLDDGLICALAGGRYYLTFTSGGAEHAEAWLRDWIDSWGFEVHVLNQTHALGAINVAGPRARELIAAVSGDRVDNEALPYLGLSAIEVAGVSCQALRIGFVGELGYELHHPRTQSVRLWDALLEAGAGLGILPHGLEALRLLRIEKGHIIVGQDTDFDSTPAKLGLGWAARLEKTDFVGRRALERVSALPLTQKLVGVRFEGDVTPSEGTPLTADGLHVGHLTSSRFSPALGYGVALGWLRSSGAAFPEHVTAGGIGGEVVSLPFYDPSGARLRA